MLLQQLGQSIVAMKLGDHGKHPTILKWTPAIPKNVGDFVSSYHHVDVSKILTLLGIPHRNEVKVEFGIVVDILIAKEKGSKGIVIEVDGPMHYESYLKAPLGTVFPAYY